MSKSGARAESISLLGIVQDIWAGRKIVAITVAVSLVLCVIYLHLAPRLYTVSLDVAPVTQDTPDQSSSSGGLAGLKSILGNSLGLDQGSYGVFLEALRTNKIVAQAILKRPDLLHVMFASEWDSENQQWAEPFSLRRIVSSGVKRVLGISVVPWGPPNISRVRQYLAQLDVARNPENPLTEVSFEVADPAFGRELLSSVIKSLDDYMKQETKQRADAYMANIQLQLTTTNTVEVRQSLIDLLTQEEKISIAASSPLPYVAHVFGPITASDAPTSPSPLVDMAVALITGLLAGSAIVLASRKKLNRAS